MLLFRLCFPRVKMLLTLHPAATVGRQCTLKNCSAQITRFLGSVQIHSRVCNLMSN
ncbi:hypothetical protein KC19_3G179900 [Ceratodon purpureus]|uniref:Uncharacterized protein n=1 Tax=Ceratodon purpureus TaxID=3225 RepID=A0A8T0IJT1_CERPU|nr:hypothetical protein KC19_3G179900 [Ceratodon purpureus]